jgi:hypothetical protein
MIPNIPEQSRNRKRIKRGRTRLFNAAIHALRMQVERTFAWEEKCQQLRLRWKPSYLGFRRFHPDDQGALQDWLLERTLEHDKPTTWRSAAFSPVTSRRVRGAEHARP